MESEETSSGEYKETLVFLDFNDKIPQEVLDDKTFIRIVNLEDKNPLVQVNDMVFKGTFDYSLGTNLFFKKLPNPGLSEFPFHKPTKHKLEFFKAITKTLNCKQMRIPPTTATLPECNDRIQFNFKWDYEELLKKFEQGTLDLKDMIKCGDNESPEESVSNVCEEQNVEPPPIPESSECENIEMAEPSDNPVIKVPEEPYEELRCAYENLLCLSRTPVKRNVIVEAVECDPEYVSSYDYRCIECKVLEPPLFSYFTSNKNMDKDNVSDHVDVSRCVRLGIIAPSNNFHRILTEDEKKNVFTMKNFANLSLAARYSVLLSHAEDLEKQVESNSDEENAKKDKFGRTPKETLDVFKKLLTSLENRIQSVIKE